MNKIVISIAVIIGIGGYFVLNKTKQAVADFGDEQLSALVAKYKQKTYPIKLLQSQPSIQQANFKITESTNNSAISLLSIALVDGSSYEIPLNSVITRGKTEYKGKAYGYGKIVTKPIISKIKELPTFIKADTLVNTTYLGLDGEILNVTDIAPIEQSEEGLDFKGYTVILSTTFANTSVYNFNLIANGFKNSHDDRMIQIEPYAIKYSVAEDGTYVGESSPLIFSFSQHGSESLKIGLGKGNYQGNYKEVKELDMPIRNGIAKLDTLSVTLNGKTVKLNQLVLGGGLYKNGKLVNLKAEFSANIDEKTLAESGLLAMLPIQITPKSLAFSYALNSVGYDVANTLSKAISQFNITSDKMMLTEDEQRSILQSLQKTNVSHKMDISIKTIEGDADANMALSLSDAGKTASTDALLAVFQQQSPEQAKAFFNSKANVKMNKNLADITQATAYLIMSGAKEDGDDYVIEGELKDGISTINGQPKK